MGIGIGMGMTTVTRVARVPWDVPVRVVALPEGAVTARTRRAELGVAVPGIAAVEVELVRASGTDAELLTDVRPVRGPVRGGRSDTTLADVLAGLVVDGAIPVAVDGTPFARHVLSVLADVPVGARRTYAELAADAGRPRAVRAVASVMARNRVPLVLPCHRIVPSSGGTGRYAWGDAVKVALLAAEADA